MKMRDELDQSIRTMQIGSGQGPAGFNPINSPMTTAHPQLTGSNTYSQGITSQLQHLS